MCQHGGTGKHQDIQLTVVLTKPHRKLVPCHVIAPGGVGSFFAVGSHMMRGAGGLLFDRNPILLANVVYLVQPTCTIGPWGVVRRDVP